uniref:Uncharacterized protein n=1 Tax=Glossina pallidipes TaxID=7398 RepID=A0A1A9ZNG0_GLOPL
MGFPAPPASFPSPPLAPSSPPAAALSPSAPSSLFSPAASSAGFSSPSGLAKELAIRQATSAYPNPSLWDYLGEGFGGGLLEDLPQ